MEYFFDDPHNLTELRRILSEWDGTPYRHRCGVKGIGTDCIHFVIRVLAELNLIKWNNNLIPDYPRDWHLHNTRELLLEELLKKVPGELLAEPAIELIAAQKIKDGDIILSHYGKASSHAIIYCDGYCWQSIDGTGVLKLNINNADFKQQMKYVYRLFIPKKGN